MSSSVAVIQKKKYRVIRILTEQLDFSPSFEELSDSNCNLFSVFSLEILMFKYDMKIRLAYFVRNNNNNTCIVVVVYNI